eukprot:7752117-Alexandrium_andersonii.AAC.1
MSFLVSERLLACCSIGCRCAAYEAWCRGLLPLRRSGRAMCRQVWAGASGIDVCTVCGSRWSGHSQGKTLRTGLWTNG